MKALPVVQYPHPALTTPCEQVTVFDDALHFFLEDLTGTMLQGGGVGIAANQVASKHRVFLMVVRAATDSTRTFEVRGRRAHVLECINPVITNATGVFKAQEGCLSFGPVHGWVQRAQKLDLTFQDRTGVEHTQTFQGIEAVCVQHEEDHLAGVTFLQRMTPLTLRLFLRDYAKAPKVPGMQTVLRTEPDDGQEDADESGDTEAAPTMEASPVRKSRTKINATQGTFAKNPGVRGKQGTAGRGGARGV